MSRSGCGHSRSRPHAASCPHLPSGSSRAQHVAQVSDQGTPSDRACLRSPVSRKPGKHCTIETHQSLQPHRNTRKTKATGQGFYLLHILQRKKAAAVPSVNGHGRLLLRALPFSASAPEESSAARGAQVGPWWQGSDKMCLCSKHPSSKSHPVFGAAVWVYFFLMGLLFWPMWKICLGNKIK